MTVPFTVTTRWLQNHKTRKEKKSCGGVVLSIKESIKSDQSRFNSTSLGLVGAIIKSVFNNVLVCVGYRPPNADHEFLQEFSRFLQCAKESKCKNVIIPGDFKRRFFRKSRIFCENRSKHSDQAFAKKCSAAIFCFESSSKIFAKKNRILLDF